MIAIFASLSVTAVMRNATLNCKNALLFDNPKFSVQSKIGEFSKLILDAIDQLANFFAQMNVPHSL